MARPKRYSEVRRMLLRKLDDQTDDVLRELRDRLWDDLIARAFRRGGSVSYLADDQPQRHTTQAVEAAIRRVMRRN